jgi:hypothetical protein
VLDPLLGGDTEQLKHICGDRKAECLQSATLHNVHQAARDGSSANDPHKMSHPSASMTKVKPPSHAERGFQQDSAHDRHNEPSLTRHNVS